MRASFHRSFVLFDLQCWRQRIFKSKQTRWSLKIISGHNIQWEENRSPLPGLLKANSNFKTLQTYFEPKAYLPIFNTGLPSPLSHMHSTFKFTELFHLCLLTQLIGRVGSMPIVQMRTKTTGLGKPRCLPALRPFLRPVLRLNLAQWKNPAFIWSSASRHLRPASLPKQLSWRLISAEQTSV